MSKIITLAEVAEHNTDQSCFMAIDGKVYDVTKFLVEHPGGEEVMMDHAGKEATDAFEDVGHSLDARDMLADLLIGELPEEEKTAAKVKTNVAPSAPSSGASDWTMYIVLGAVAAAIAAYLKFSQ